MPDGTQHPQEAVTKVVATAFNLSVGLSDGRQITFQSGFEGDEDDTAVNERLDRMMRLADRQKARYEIPEVERNILKIQETLANLAVDGPRVEKNFELQQAGRREQIAEIKRMRADEIAKHDDAINGHILQLNKQKQDALDRGHEAHRKSGKLAGYKPVGATKVEIDRITSVLEKVPDLRENTLGKINREFDDQIARVEAELLKADAERDNTLENMKISVERWERSLIDSAAELARLRALLGG